MALYVQGSFVVYNVHCHDLCVHCIVHTCFKSELVSISNELSLLQIKLPTLSTCYVAWLCHVCQHLGGSGVEQWGRRVMLSLQQEKLTLPPPPPPPPSQLVSLVYLHTTYALPFSSISGGGGGNKGKMGDICTCIIVLNNIEQWYRDTPPTPTSFGEG